MKQSSEHNRDAGARAGNRADFSRRIPHIGHPPSTQCSPRRVQRRRVVPLRFSSLARNTQGQELVEAALVLPLLFMVLMGIFWFGEAFSIYGTITQAARQGVRAAVAPVCATCPAASKANGNTPVQDAIAAVDNTLTAAHLSTSQVMAPASTPSFPGCAIGGAVGCDSSVTGNNICVQVNVQLSTNTGSEPGTCGTVVSFGYKYPYHFHIPYTSLDLGNITLPAQAQMRLETQ
jgi:Flp pilus assembly protein TadG